MIKYGLIFDRESETDRYGDYTCSEEHETKCFESIEKLIEWITPYVLPDEYGNYICNSFKIFTSMDEFESLSYRDCGGERESGINCGNEELELKIKLLTKDAIQKGIEKIEESKKKAIQEAKEKQIKQKAYDDAKKIENALKVIKENKPTPFELLKNAGFTKEEINSFLRALLKKR